MRDFFVDGYFCWLHCRTYIFWQCQKIMFILCEERIAIYLLLLLSSLVCSYVSVCLGLSMYMKICMQTRGQHCMSSLFRSVSTLLFETGFIIKPGTH